MRPCRFVQLYHIIEPVLQVRCQGIGTAFEIEFLPGLLFEQFDFLAAFRLSFCVDVFSLSLNCDTASP